MLGNLDDWRANAARAAAPPARNDLQKLIDLKNRCASARASAMRLNRAVSQRSAEDALKNFREHAGRAVGLAREITDEIYRNSALFYLIDLFMEAGNVAYARRLLDVMNAGPLRDRIVQAHRQLGAPS
jgi:hypothetical protein